MKIVRGVTVTVLMLLVMPWGVLAQDEPEDVTGDLRNDFTGSGVYAPEVSITMNELAFDETTGILSGILTATNRSDLFLGDLFAEVSIFEPLPELEPNTLVQDTSLLYGRFIFPEEVRLSPNEEKQIPFEYQAPQLPAGEWRVQGALTTSQNQKLGYVEKNLEFGSSEGGFIISGKFGVVTTDSEEVFEPLYGVNVDGGSEVSLNYAAQNIGTEAVTATPVLTVYNFDMMGGQSDVVRGEEATWAPDQEIEGSLTVTADSKPESYYSLLHFEDAEGRVISSLGEFRWVVKGESGEVLTGSFTELSDSRAVARVTVVGAADQETIVQAFLRVRLLDGTDTIREGSSQPLVLDGYSVQTTDIEFALDEPLRQPGVEIELVASESGLILDSYSFRVDAPEYETATDPAQSKDPVAAYWWLVGAGVGVILLIGIGWLLRRQKQNKDSDSDDTGSGVIAGNESTVAAVGLVMVLIGSAWGLKVEAQQGVTFSSHGLVPVFGVHGYVSEPIHDGVYSDPSNIITRFQLYRSHCSNSADVGRAEISYLTNGGKSPVSGRFAGFSRGAHCGRGGYTRLETSFPAESSFRRLVNASFSPQGCGARYCVIRSNYVGRLALPEDLENTTLVYKMFNDRHRGCVGGSFGHYLWVNLKQPSQCNDGLDNDQDGVIDELDPGCHEGDDINNPYDPEDSSENEVPIAVITTQEGRLNQNVTASGSDSSDPDGEIVAFDWTVTSPTGATQTFTTEDISFVGNEEGNWSLSLTVTDNQGGETTTETTVSVLDVPLLAVIETTGNTVNQPVTLDGSNSTPEEEIVSYAWSVTDPLGAEVAVDDANSPTTQFTPIRDGQFVISLTVTNQDGDRQNTTVSVQVGAGEFDPGAIGETE